MALPTKWLRTLDRWPGKCYWKCSTMWWQGQKSQVIRRLETIVLILKKPPCTDINNYPPITHISCVLKLFTKILAKRVSAAVEKEDIIGPYQSGFRPNRSSSDNIFTLNSILEFNKSKKLLSHLLFLKEAYDKVDRGIYPLSKTVTTKLPWLFLVPSKELLLPRQCLLGNRGREIETSVPEKRIETGLQSQCDPVNHLSLRVGQEDGLERSRDATSLWWACQHLTLCWWYNNHQQFGSRSPSSGEHSRTLV